MNKPIRVLQVLTIMNRGGAENMIMNYYRNMDRSKVQFDFLLHRKEEGVFDNEIKSLGGKIYKLSSIAPKNYFKYKQELEFFFNNNSYDIIHSHLNALSYIILSVAKRKGVRVRIAHSHIAVEPFAIKKIFRKNTDIKATIKDSIQSLLRRKARKYATNYFACGEKAANWLYGKKNKNNVQIINNAIDSKKFTYNQKMDMKVRQELNLEGKKIIGHVGRFDEQKNHFFLIEIFEELTKSISDSHLVLIGDGTLRKKIEKRVKELNIQDKVLFLGVQENVPKFLQSIDLFLLPSLYEGLPLVLIEAQASGIPIVASDTISKEVDIIGMTKFCSLNWSAKSWAKIITQNIHYKRTNTYQFIVESGYDIAKNADFLQEFYLKN